jgi:hypothetical protein
MSIKHPEAWYPPKQNHGGENIPRLFALILLDEIVARICAQARNFDLPIAQEIDAALLEKDNVLQRLKQEGAYTYFPNRSIFDDYKRMLCLACIKIGSEMGVEDPRTASEEGFDEYKRQFYPDMPTEKALDLARNIVTTWDWE